MTWSQNLKSLTIYLITCPWELRDGGPGPGTCSSGLRFVVNFFGDDPANSYIAIVNSWSSLNWTTYKIKRNGTMDSHIDQVHSTVKSLIVDPLSQDIKLAHVINMRCYICAYIILKCNVLISCLGFLLMGCPGLKLSLKFIHSFIL